MVKKIYEFISRTDNIDKNIQKLGCFGCFSYLKTKKHIKTIKPIKPIKLEF